MASVQDDVAGPVLDLSNCDREPIHVPGRVQPHGALFALSEPDLYIGQASASAARLLGRGADALLGRPVEAAVGADARRVLAAALASGDLRTVNPLALCVPTPGGPRAFDGVLHRHAGRLILELEPDRGDAAGAGADALVRFTLARLQGELRLKDFCHAAAREVRALTGFDRVMVYRFDPDWNGEVIAEAKRDDLEPFLGLNYPASDIPAQARRLYRLNLVRHIPDVTYESAPVVPELDPDTGRPLDLSFAVLRSVSPIHVEYLKNMGVAASLSISILKGGELWGLVACHHYAPRFLPYRLRAACESLGVLMSLQLTAKLDSEELRCRVDAQTRLGRLAHALGTADDLESAVAGRRDDFLGLAGADGGAVVAGGRVLLVGRTPGEPQVRALAAWLRDYTAGGGAYSTHALPAEFPAAAAYGDRASGLLAVPLSADGDDCLMWFRPEAVEAVHWAGDPHAKRVVVGPNGPRLSPRGSFALWREEHRGRSRFWSACERDAAAGLREAALAALARRGAELRAESRRKDEFLAMLGHELRNPLAPIRNAVEVLRRRGDDPATVEWARAVTERQTTHLTRMVDDLLDVSRVGQGKLRLDLSRLDLAALVRQAVEDHRPLLANKGVDLLDRLTGRAVWVHGDPTRLTQAVGNLITNAGKFTDPGGRVTVRVGDDARTGRARVTVADTGVGIDPALLARVFDPFEQVEGSLSRTREGLGLGLALVKGIVELHGGEAHARSDGAGRGSEFGFWLPLAAAPAEDAAPAADAGPEDRKLKVLVVDDNRDGADSMAMLLELDGHAVRVAYTGRQAGTAAREFRPDVVLCDIGLPDVSGYDVARDLRRDPATAHARLIATTGFGSESDEQKCLAAGIELRLTKPVDPADLRAALAARPAGVP